MTAQDRARMIKVPSALYRLVWEAIRSRQQITCVYKGFSREACPIILGYSADGREAVSAYQFAGETSKGGKLPGWRCLHLAGVGELKLRAGKWYEGESHKQAQSCVRYVDVDANIPDTLTREEPLAFGSRGLRPPRMKP